MRCDLVALEASQGAVVAASNSFDFGKAQHLLRCCGEAEHLSPICLLRPDSLKSEFLHAIDAVVR